MAQKPHKPKERLIGRSAITGQIIPVDVALRRRKTSVVETVPIGRRKKGGK